MEDFKPQKLENRLKHDFLHYVAILHEKVGGMHR
jgi:hypothetical protein